MLLANNLNCFNSTPRSSLDEKNGSSTKSMVSLKISKKFFAFLLSLLSLFGSTSYKSVDYTVTARWQQWQKPCKSVGKGFFLWDTMTVPLRWCSCCIEFSMLLHWDGAVIPLKWHHNLNRITPQKPWNNCIISLPLQRELIATVKSHFFIWQKRFFCNLIWRRNTNVEKFVIIWVIRGV